MTKSQHSQISKFFFNANLALQVSCSKPAHRFLTAFRKEPAWPPASPFSPGFCHKDTHTVPPFQALHMLFLPPGMLPTSMPTKLTPSHLQHPSQSIISSRLSLTSCSHPSWVKCPFFSASMANAMLILSPLVDPRLPEDRSGIQNNAPPKCPHSNLWNLSLNPLTWQRGTKIADGIKVVNQLDLK